MFYGGVALTEASPLLIGLDVADLRRLDELVAFAIGPNTTITIDEQHEAVVAYVRLQIAKALHRAPIPPPSDDSQPVPATDAPVPLLPEDAAPSAGSSPEGGPPSDLDRLIVLATKWHAGQTDKAGLPYILHPLAVALRGESWFERALGITHDLVEDTELTPELVAAVVYDPTRRAALARGLDVISRRHGEPYGAFIARICETPEVIPVKINDVEHNLSSERLDGLDAATRSRLLRKYEPALRTLYGALGLSYP